ncbi:hypothetical protein [Mycolicibacterium moriokaense]|uniref:Uncharacterized protein n=1 Tax=Mycolicibacterium moriokaense TaxID=39691 RepID=A0A318HSL4_9MYCO|nr:hypothetical protein [Mycolicibacterium moriokaense]PXX08011.1 hypothetical protein C8E89_10927 [Mycolicibacterium moriokaense]
MTLSEGPGGVVVAAELVLAAVVGTVAGAAVFGALVLGGVYRLVGGALEVVGALVVVVNAGAGAVVGLAAGALGGAGGAGAGVDALVAGAGCSFCGDLLVSPPTRTTIATMTMNAATMAAPIIVRPPSVLNHGVVPGLGSLSVVS